MKMILYEFVVSPLPMFNKIEPHLLILLSASNTYSEIDDLEQEKRYCCTKNNCRSNANELRQEERRVPVEEAIISQRVD